MTAPFFATPAPFGPVRTRHLQPWLPGPSVRVGAWPADRTPAATVATQQSQQSQQSQLPHLLVRAAQKSELEGVVLLCGGPVCGGPVCGGPGGGDPARPGPEGSPDIADVEVWVLPAGPPHTLLGLQVPRHWDHATLVFACIGRPLHNQSLPLSCQRAWAALHVRRDGIVAMATAPASTIQPEEGPLLDVLQRSLGMQTAAPRMPPGWVSKMLWIDAVVGAAYANPATAWTWRALAALHPLAGPPTSPTPQQLVHASQAVSWSALRAHVARWGNVPSPVRKLTALGSWLDHGAWVRQVMGWLPDSRDLIEDLFAILSPFPTARAAMRVALHPDVHPSLFGTAGQPVLGP